MDWNRIIWYCDPKRTATEFADPSSTSRLVLADQALKGDHIIPARIEGATFILDHANRHPNAQGLSMAYILNSKHEAQMGTIYFDQSVPQPERVKLAKSLLNIEIAKKPYTIAATFVGGQLRFCAPVELTNEFVLRFEESLKSICHGCSGVAPDTFKVQRPRPENVRTGKKSFETARWLKNQVREGRPKVLARYNGETLDNTAPVLMFLNAVNGHHFDETIVNHASKYLQERGALDATFNGDSLCIVAPYALAKELHDCSLYHGIGFHFKCPFVEGELAPMKQKAAEELDKKVAEVLEQQRQRIAWQRAEEEEAMKKQQEEASKLEAQVREIYKPPTGLADGMRDVPLEEVPEIYNLLGMQPETMRMLKDVPLPALNKKVEGFHQTFNDFPESLWTTQTAQAAIERLKDICSIAHATGYPVSPQFVLSTMQNFGKLKTKPVTPEKKAEIDVWLQALHKVWDRAKVSPMNQGQQQV